MTDSERLYWVWSAEGCLLTAEERKADYHGPNDAAHRAIHDATEHLMNNRVTDAKARRGLRDALDVADRAPQPKSFPSRAIRFGR